MFIQLHPSENVKKRKIPKKRKRIHLRKENLIRKIDERKTKNSGVLCVPIVTFYDVSGCS
jgi:hypothetical protein